jgi:hypothetical protein
VAARIPASERTNQVIEEVNRAGCPWIEVCGGLPCIFPVNQVSGPRDGFALDCPHRQDFGDGVALAAPISGRLAFPCRPERMIDPLGRDD